MNKQLILKYVLYLKIVFFKLKTLTTFLSFVRGFILGELWLVHYKVGRSLIVF